MPKEKENRRNYDDFGPHKYKHQGVSVCKYGCGCFTGPTNSGGPAGIDPDGHCPNNPLNGKKQHGNSDYEDCVNGRIRELETELQKTKEELLLRVER